MDTTEKVTMVCLLCILQQIARVTSQTVRMSIQPNSVTSGGQSSTSSPFPTLTPTEVVLECRLEGSAQFVYAMYMKRRRQMEYDFTTFAEINIGDNNAMLSMTAPSDIRSKMPRLTGTTASSNARLTARIYVNQITCQDEATYMCSIHYKPQGYESRIGNATSNLTVAVLPTLFSITASRVGTTGAFPGRVQNNTAVDINTDLEFTCTGGIGRNPSTLIEWHWRINNDIYFTRYTPPNSGDIQQRNPTQMECSFSRTSVLRYRTSNADYLGFAFRCEVAIPSYTGTVRSYSPEFHVQPGYGFEGINSGRTMKSNIPMTFMIVSFWIIYQLCRRH